MKLLLFVFFLVLSLNLNAQDVNYFIPNEQFTMNKSVLIEFKEKTIKKIDEFKIRFRNEYNNGQIVEKDSIILETMRTTISQSKAKFVYELKKLVADLRIISDGLDGLTVEPDEATAIEFRTEFRGVLQDVSLKYFINFSTTPGIGANSTESSLSVSPSTTLTLNVMLGENKPKGNIVDRGWGIINGSLDFSYQDKDSEDSVNAFTKILNYGTDLSLKLNAKFGTTFEVYLRELKIVFGGSFIYSNISNKKIVNGINDGQFIEGQYMLSYNGTFGIWLKLAKEVFFLVGYKYEKRIVPGASKKGWLYEQLDNAYTNNGYLGINIYSFQILCNYLFNSNKSIDDTNRFQFKLGTFFNFGI